MAFTTLRGEGHSASGWDIGGDVQLHTASPKSIHLGNGQLLIVLRCLLVVLVSMPLHIVNRCCSGFPVSRAI